MKPQSQERFLLALLVILTGVSSLLAQSNFQNLNFEAANIPAGTQAGTEFSANAAIPGWSASTGYVIYDGDSLGGALVTVNDSRSPFITFTPLQGNYSIILWGGVGEPNEFASISQTGLVPANAESIQMDLSTLGFPVGPFVVALNGQAISMSPLQTFPNYTLYGGNISSYADQMETLSITQYLPTAGPAPAALAIDDIQFSNQEIPEPGTWALMLCGATLLGLSRWKRTG